MCFSFHPKNTGKEVEIECMVPWRCYGNKKMSAPLNICFLKYMFGMSVQELSSLQVMHVHMHFVHFLSNSTRGMTFSEAESNLII